MKEKILLSILIPSIPSRLHMLELLISKLQKQIGSLPVQISCAIDNKKISIGEKRDNLIQTASSDFVCFCDDDDDFSEDYIQELVVAIRNNPETDVVVFNQRSYINDHQFTVNFGLEYENEPAQHPETNEFKSSITRKPFHVCAWRTELAKTSRFPHINYGEDDVWLRPLWKKAKSQHRINKMLHFYRYSDSISEAKKDV